MKKEENADSGRYEGKTNTGAIILTNNPQESQKSLYINKTKYGAIIIPSHSKEEMPSEKSKEIEKPSEKSKMGKKSRAKGQRFELKVRQHLESIGWTVSKWTNTVDYEKNKVVPAKRKYNPFSKVMTIGTGFPDFVCFRSIDKKEHEETIGGTLIPADEKSDEKRTYEVIGLEVKGNGYLDQIEKGMCLWLLKNKVFSRILIAKKPKEGKEIEYIDFEVKYNKDNKE